MAKSPRDKRQSKKKHQNTNRRSSGKAGLKGRGNLAEKETPIIQNVLENQKEQIKRISASLEEMVDNQYLQGDLDERLTVTQEKQAQNMESLLGVLANLIDAVAPMIPSVSKSSSLGRIQRGTLEPYAIPANVDKFKVLSRDEVKAMIGELRGTGLSYEKIANKLNNRKIRGVSGNLKQYTVFFLNNWNLQAVPSGSGPHSLDSFKAELSC